MKTTKHIFLAILTALLLVPAIGWAQTSYTISGVTAVQRDGDTRAVEFDIQAGTETYHYPSDPVFTNIPPYPYFTISGVDAVDCSVNSQQTLTITATAASGFDTTPKTIVWDPYTTVKIDPAFDWDGETDIFNPNPFDKVLNYGELTFEIPFKADYYGKLVHFELVNSFSNLIYFASKTFDVPNNKWVITLPAEAASMVCVLKDFTVTKRQISDPLVQFNMATPAFMDGLTYVYEYTGSEIQALLNIRDTERDYTLAASGTDYSVSAGDVKATDVGNYSFTIDGAGYNYDGSKTVNWRIQKSISHSDVTVTVDPAIFNGTEYDLDAVKDKVVVKDNGTTLVEGTNYTLSLKTGHQPFTNAKTYVDEIVITGIDAGGYVGNRYASFVINPKDIALCDVTAEAAYTGAAIDPGEDDGNTPPTYTYITVKDGATTLTATVDYNVTVLAGTYQDAGTYNNAVTITAVDGGNYIGTKTVDFTITDGTSIDDVAITVTVDPAVYKGAAYTLDDVKAKVVVKNGATELTEGTDYDLSIITTAGYTNAKTYANDIVITGKGTYYGIRTADFIVTPKDIALTTVNAAYPYDGAEVLPADVHNYVTVNDEAIATPLLVEGTDYEVVALDPAPGAAGKYQDAGVYPNAVTINAVDGGNYVGSKTVNFLITNANDIAGALILATDIYTGAALPPTSDNIKVILFGTELTYDTDFTFVKNEADDDYLDAKTYENAITITGKGAYYGTVTGTYVIQPRPLSDPDIEATAEDLVYTGAALAPVVTVKYKTNTIPDANYTYTPTSVTEAGTYTVNIEGRYNLTGTTTATFSVTKDMATFPDEFTVLPDPIPTQVYDGVNPVEPAISVYDNGRELTEGVDYTVAYTDNEAEGEATITITGMGVYSGTLTRTFLIIAEYFTEGDYTYHALGGDDVAVGNDGAVATTATGNLTIAPTVDRDIAGTTVTFNVIGLETAAFKDYTAMLTLTLPASITYIEDKTFEGATALRWIDASTADAFKPSSLDRTIEATPFYGVPLQALVFLTDNTVEGENYVYLVGASDFRCDEFKIYDDISGTQTNFGKGGNNGYQWAYENPYDFKANRVINTRQLSGNQHYTTCLPYNLTIPAGVKAYQLSASSTILIGFVEVTGTLNAFEPYVLIPTNSGQLLSAGETTIPTTVGVYTDADGHKINPTPAAGTVGGYFLAGSMRYTLGAATDYIMQGGNTWKSLSGATGWDGGCILPMRAYITASDTPVKPFLNATYSGATELDELFEKSVIDSNAERYDLEGRKLGAGQLRKGIYIIDGHKVVQK